MDWTRYRLVIADPIYEITYAVEYKDDNDSWRHLHFTSTKWGARRYAKKHFARSRSKKPGEVVPWNG